MEIKVKPASGFHTAGQDVAKAIVGMTYDDAEAYVEKNAFVFSPELASCQFMANRIQYRLQSGVIVVAWHG